MKDPDWKLDKRDKTELSDSEDDDIAMCTSDKKGTKRKRIVSKPDLDDTIETQTSTAASSTSNTNEPLNEPMMPMNTEENTIDHEEVVDTDQTIPKRKKAKKGMGDPNTWERNRNKALRMEGNAYKGVKAVNGKKSFCVERGERVIGERSCTKRSRQCDRVSDDARKDMFQAYWKHMDWNEKKAFVRHNVVRSEPEAKSAESRRQFTYKYYLVDKQNKYQVCKELFLATLNISEHTVYEWLKNTDNHGLPKTSETEKSRTSKSRDSKFHCNHSVKEFFDSIPKLPSHYCRVSSQKQYLEPTYQSLSQVHEVYKTFCENKQYRVAGKKFFTKVFNENNLAIFRPRKDQCDTCVGFETHNTSEDEYRQHMQRKEEARSEKDGDKARALDNNNVKVMCMDVQSVLLCPKVEASATYYKTKLACHNYTIYDMATKAVICYFWHEGEGGLTANMFASCIDDHLENIVNPNTEEVIIYSDGCGYQNRNATMANTLLRFAVKHNITVTQKFLEKGHTQMEVDSVHSTIERRLRKRQIYSPANYVEVFKQARQQPYDVKYVDHNFFMDFAGLKSYDTIRPGSRVGDPVVTDIRCLRYFPEGLIKYKLLYSDEFSEVPKKRNAPTPTGHELLPNLYSAPLKIKDTKFQHLQQLKAVIPKDYHSFYDTLDH